VIGVKPDSVPLFYWETTLPFKPHVVESFCNFFMMAGGEDFSVSTIHEFQAKARLLRNDSYFRGGSVFYAKPPYPNVPRIARSQPPDTDPDIDILIDKIFDPVLVKNARELYVRANDIPNTPEPYEKIYQGTPAHPQFMQEFIDEDVFKFLDTPACETILGRVAANIVYSIKDDGKNLKLPITNFLLKENRDLILTMPVPNGGAGDCVADPSFGSVNGTKREMRFVACATVHSLISEFAIKIEKEIFQNGMPVRHLKDWVEVIRDFFSGKSWRYFYQGFVKIHRKSETIKRGKIPRMIWAVDLLSIILDYVVFKNTHTAHKNQFERGHTHGITAKGGGYTYLVDRIAHYYSKQFFLNKNESLRENFLRYFMKDEYHDLTEAKFTNLIASKLYTNDDDVVAWDFSQYPVVFECYNMKVLYASGVNIKAVQPYEALYFFLMCYCSQTRSVSLLNVKKVGEESERVSFKIRGLNSGEFNTAHGGSSNHADYRITMNVKKYKLFYFLEQKLLSLGYLDSDINLLSVRLAMLSSPADHHSDDLIDFLIYLATPVLSLFDTNYFYATEGMMLQPEMGAKKRNMIRGIDLEFLKSLVPDDLRASYNLDFGTYQGRDFNNGVLFKPVKLYDAQFRYDNCYKPLYTKFKDGKVDTLGGVFLQNNFVNLDEFNYVMLRREPTRLLAKMMRVSDSILTPAQWVARLRSYAYLAVSNKDFYEAVRLVESEYRVVKGLTDSELALKLVIESSKMLKDMFYNTGGLRFNDIKEFPSWDTVMAFYTTEVDPAGIIAEKHTRKLRAPPSNKYLIPVGEKGNREVNYPDVVVSDDDLKGYEQYKLGVYNGLITI